MSYQKKIVDTDNPGKKVMGHVRNQAKMEKL